MPRIFNKNLKFIRQQKGISQQELADKLKLDRSTISRWENDEMDITVGNAIQISNFFNIPMEDLTGRDLSIDNQLEKYDELELLFSKNKDILTEDDKETIKFVIERAKRKVDEQLGEGQDV